MNTLTLAVRRLPHGKDLPLPAYGSAGAAGLDLMAAVGADLVLKPGKHALVPTGIEIALPAGFEAEVRPRSGLALRHAVTVLNAAVSRAHIVRSCPEPWVIMGLRAADSGRECG